MKPFIYSSILTWLLVLPLIGAFILGILPISRPRLIRFSAVAVSAGNMLIALAAGRIFNWAPQFAVMAQLQQNVRWFQDLNVRYHVGVDAMSMVTILVLCGISLLAILASYGVNTQVKAYYVVLLLLEGCSVGAAASMDLFLFYILSTLSLFPCFLLIGVWGGTRRRPAALKLALFWIISSSALLGSCILISLATRGVDGFAFGTLNFTQIAADARLRQALGPAQAWTTAAFWLFMLAVGIRLGTAGLHFWLPDAVAESAAPSAMMVLACQFLLAGYALTRIVVSLFPLQLMIWRNTLAILGAAGVIYGALCALAQSDFRRVIAYWLMVQAGYIVLGVAAGNVTGLNGGFLLSLGASITTIALLWTSHVIEIRANHRDLSRLGGLAQLIPDLFIFSMLGFMAALALPGLVVFNGDLLATIGMFHAAAASSVGVLFPKHGLLLAALVMCLAMVLMAAVLLWTIERLFFGSGRPEHQHFHGLSARERLVFVPVFLALLAGGILPTQLVLNPIAPVLQALVHTIGGAGH
ncbi:MAG: complex I subunit 4 family protein [Phycisphaerae bacterium]